MSFERLAKDMNIIAQLDDEPNDVGGLTSAELKAKFDEGGNAVKDAFNGLIDALEAGTGAASIGAKDADGNDSTVQDALDALGALESKVRLFTLSGVSDLETAQAAYEFLQSGGFPVLKELAGVPRFFVYNSKKTEGGKEYFYFDRTDDLSGPMEDGDTAFYHDSRALIVEDGAVTQIQYNADFVARYLSTYGLTEQSEAFVPTVPAHPATKQYVDNAIDGARGTGALVLMHAKQVFVESRGQTETVLLADHLPIGDVVAYLCSPEIRIVGAGSGGVVLEGEFEVPVEIGRLPFEFNGGYFAVGSRVYYGVSDPWLQQTEEYFTVGITARLVSGVPSWGPWTKCDGSHGGDVFRHAIWQDGTDVTSAVKEALNIGG